MSTNHHAMIRYQALDKCFRNPHHKYFIDDLVKACCDAIYNNQGIVDGVKRRQVWKDISFMESEEGWSAPIEHIKEGRKVYFRYSDISFSINNQPLSQEEIDKLKETQFMLSRFKGMPHFEWIQEIISHLEDRFGLKGQTKSVIGFEENPYYVGSHYLSDIFNAIINRQVLRIDYKKFDGSIRNWTIHPYYIKEYNNRWFLFGLNADKRTITNIPLDRITDCNPTDIEYIDTDINFEEYFDDVIGATVPDKAVEKILLRFDRERFPYVESKPIHPSMKIKDRENCIVEIEVIPNRELEAQIFFFGNQVEVLKPEWFRQQVADKVADLCAKYREDTKSDIKS